MYPDMLDQMHKNVKRYTFSEAYMMMLKGYKIKRPGWNGYWYIDAKTQKVVIHLADGTEKTGDFTQETILNCIAEDWQLSF